MDNQKIISTLNSLLSKCYDGEKGYKEAREQVDSLRLRNVFDRLVQQRYDFGHELKAEIERLGGTPEKGDTIASKIHRAFMDIKAKTSNNTEELMLEEVVRGEENAVNNYNDALEDLPTGSISYDLVAKQRNQIKEALKRMETLEEVHDK